MCLSHIMLSKYLFKNDKNDCKVLEDDAVNHKNVTDKIKNKSKNLLKMGNNYFVLSRLL